MSAVAAAALLGVSGAAAQNGSAITGTVTSPTGALEGVLVTAKKDGAKIAITVVTDEKGRYSFPANRLEPGKYNLKIRATGFFARRPADRRCRRRQDRDRRSQADEDRQHRAAADERRVDAQHAGPGLAEGVPAGLTRTAIR